MDSVWEDTARRVHFDALKGSKSTDVLIIGGGIAGILCTCKLKEAGVDCMLVEANEICDGITKNTTAKITFGQLLSEKNPAIVDLSDTYGSTITK